MTTPTLPRLALLLSLGVLAAGCQFRKPIPPPTAQQQADDLANAVAMAAGAGVSPRVTTASFNFVVREGGQVKLSRSHLWDLRAKTDTVSSNGDKPVIVDTTKPAPEDPASAAAFKAWAEDTYWLDAPLKLFDANVTREYLGRKEVAGKEYEVLRLTRATPAGDRYDLYVDPYTSLIAFWDHMPDPDTTTRATWEDYRHPAGLKLSTLHHAGNKTITIENLSLTTE